MTKRTVTPLFPNSKKKYSIVDRDHMIKVDGTSLLAYTVKLALIEKITTTRVVKRSTAHWMSLNVIA
jgi:hypothetical protein